MDDANDTAALSSILDDIFESGVLPAKSDSKVTIPSSSSPSPHLLSSNEEQALALPKHPGGHTRVPHDTMGVQQESNSESPAEGLDEI